VVCESPPVPMPVPAQGARYSLEKEDRGRREQKEVDNREAWNGVFLRRPSTTPGKDGTPHGTKNTKTRRRHKNCFSCIRVGVTWCGLFHRLLSFFFSPKNHREARKTRQARACVLWRRRHSFSSSATQETTQVGSRTHTQKNTFLWC
jgi:hypothetical protein